MALEGIVSQRENSKRSHETYMAAKRAVAMVMTFILAGVDVTRCE